MNQEYTGENFISETDVCFLHLVSCAIHEKDMTYVDPETEAVLGYLSVNADVGAIASTTFAKMANENWASILKEHALNTSTKFYKNLMVTRNVLWILKENAIDACVLKGIDLARNYPVPEFRSSNDVDILVCDSSLFEKAESLLEKNGYEKNSKQYTPHHVVFTEKNGAVIELHKDVARPFENETRDAYISNIFKQADIFDKAQLFGCEFAVLRDGEKAFYMLLHMLEHFMTAGFGIRLLCDWTLFWKNLSKKDSYTKEVERYLSYVNGAGLKTFSDVITTICVRWLGLEEADLDKMYDKPDVSDEVIFSTLKDILDTGRLGEEDHSRLVSAEDDSLKGLLREFHHQTRVNFPKASRCFILLPVLWVTTFFIFMRNNKKMRNVSLSEVLNNTKKRAKVAKELRLWDK